MTRSNANSGTTTVLIVLLIVFTFPIWIGLAGGLIGLVAGLFGAVIGIIGAVFGAVFGIFGGVMGGLFGGWDHPFGYVSCNTLLVITLIVAIVMLSRSRRARR